MNNSVVNGSESDTFGLEKKLFVLLRNWFLIEGSNKLSSLKFIALSKNKTSSKFDFSYKIRNTNLAFTDCLNGTVCSWLSDLKIYNGNFSKSALKMILRFIC